MTHAIVALLWLTTTMAFAEEPQLPAREGEIPAAPASEGPTGPVSPIPSDGWSGATPPEIPTIHPARVHKPGLLSFQLDAVLFLQSGGGNSFTGQVAWTPFFSIGRYTLRGELGVAVPKNTLGDLFLSVNAELAFRTRINNELFLDIGGGGQKWTGLRGSTQPVATAQLTKRYDTKAPVDSIFIAYTAFFTSPLIHTFKLGIGFNVL